MRNLRSCFLLGLTTLIPYFSYSGDAPQEPIKTTLPKINDFGEVVSNTPDGTWRSDTTRQQKIVFMPAACAEAAIKKAFSDKSPEEQRKLVQIAEKNNGELEVPLRGANRDAIKTEIRLSVDSKTNELVTVDNLGNKSTSGVENALDLIKSSNIADTLLSPNFNDASSRQLQTANLDSNSAPSAREAPAYDSHAADGHFTNVTVTAATPEAPLQQSALTKAQQRIQSEIASVPSSFPAEPLSSGIRNDAAGYLIENARNSISMPLGTSNLTTNPLFGRVPTDKNSYSINKSLASLVKKDLAGKELLADFADIKDIALSSTFQDVAGKLIGDDNLSKFNLATLGAEILMENDSTSTELLAINKSLGTPYGQSIAKYNLGKSAIATTNNPKGPNAEYLNIGNFIVFNPEEWIQVSRDLTDKNKKMLRPADFDVARAVEGRKELEKLLLDLKDLHSLDLLNSVTMPMDNFIISWTKDAHEHVLESLSHMRLLSSNGLKTDEAFMRFNEFKNQAESLRSDLENLKVMAVFYAKFYDFFQNTTHNEVWKNLSPSNYEDAQRSLGILRFSLAFNSLRKKNYDKSPEQALAYLVSTSFNILADERAQRKKDLEKEQVKNTPRLAKEKDNKDD